MMRTTFDIIVETMLLGRGSIDTDRVEQGIRTYLESTSWAIAFNLLGLPQWVPYPGKRHSGNAQAYLRSELLRLVAEGRPTKTRRDDLLSLLLHASDPETGQAMNDRQIADNLLTFITAGHETTALALTRTFYPLSLHPGIEERLVGEVEAVTRGDDLSIDHIEQLTFSRQVLQEAMRLYPPALWSSWRLPKTSRLASIKSRRTARSTSRSTPSIAGPSCGMCQTNSDPNGSASTKAAGGTVTPTFRAGLARGSVLA
jgi:cytochrome P450